MINKFVRSVRGLLPDAVAWELWITVGLLVVPPILMTSDYALQVWTRLAIYVILLTGLNFINGLAGMISLAQGAFFGLGAYAAGIAAVRYDLPPILSLLIAPVVVTLAALVVGAMSIRLKEIYFAMATLGAGMVLFLLFGRMVGLTGGPNGLIGIPRFSVLGFEFTLPIVKYALVATFAVIGTMAAYNLLVSRTGRALRAYGTSESAVMAAGASPFKLRLFAFGLSGFYAGVGGALEAFDSRFISPSTFDFMMAILLVVALVVSGPGRMISPILGALLLVGIEVFAANYADYEPLILGAVFLIALQLFPRGLAGELAARLENRRERTTRSKVSGDDGSNIGLTVASEEGEK